MLTQMVNESIAYIRSKTDLQPSIALILGSGLGPLGDAVENPVVIPYGDIPHFKVSTAPGHAGRMLIGRLQGKTVLCMQGRLHFYEGYTMQEVTYPVRVMAALGVKNLMLTNACGGLDPTFIPGDLMVVTDHINFMGTNPLIGPNEDDFGTRFPDMTRVYTREYVQLAKNCAAELSVPLRAGVYISYSGPSFETPAEIRMMQGFGGQAVGMSTVPEAIVAAHSGMNVLAIACITNLAAGILDVPLSGEEVMVAAAKASGNFVALLRSIVERMEA